MLVFEAEAADQAFDVVCRQSPPVIILQVGSALNEALKFIRLVTATIRPAPMIAAASRHSTRIEQEVLRAGVRYYVPGVRQDIVERMLEAVLQPKQQKPLRMDGNPSRYDDESATEGACDGSMDS